MMRDSWMSGDAPYNRTGPFPVKLTVLLIMNRTQTHPVTGCGFIRMSEFPLLAPRPESGFTDSLQIVGSEGQFGRRRRHGSEETRQQCIENSREHGSDGYDDSRGTLFFSPSLTTFYVFFYYFPTCLRLLLQMVLVELPAWW
ncbi:hypothetical protein AMECASPLE_030657 [Ameca splendens]|uniref:Uncharacterized protein n=1 Tax=Ameca splendens TaxID=208324 RepID=A0ABV0Z4C7_9TELE